MKKILSASEMKLILGGIGGSFKGCGDDVEAFNCVTIYDNNFTSKGVVCAIDAHEARGMVWEQRNHEQDGDAGILDIKCSPV